MKPTMAEVWDQLTAEDKQTILAFSEGHTNLQLLALTKIETVLGWMSDATARLDYDQLIYPSNCNCDLCQKFGKRASEIFQILSAARSAA